MFSDIELAAEEFREQSPALSRLIYVVTCVIHSIIVLVYPTGLKEFKSKKL